MTVGVAFHSRTFSDPNFTSGLTLDVPTDSLPPRQTTTAHEAAAPASGRRTTPLKKKAGRVAPSGQPVAQAARIGAPQTHIGSPSATRQQGLTRGATMALKDRLDQHQAPRTGRNCSVGQLTASLEGDELAALTAMLGDPVKRDGWTASAIFDAVKAEGYAVSYQQINRHRGGRCGCAR